jgi:hypothetical protein
VVTSDHSPAPPAQSLGAFLAARARTRTDGRLALDAAAGVVAAAVLALWRPYSWPVWLGVALALGAFGLWGIADRSAAGMAPDVRARRPLLAARAAAAVVGAAAALLALWGALFLALGTWIS